jgi:hypothetical protein
VVPVELTGGTLIIDEFQIQEYDVVLVSHPGESHGLSLFG